MKNIEGGETQEEVLGRANVVKKPYDVLGVGKNIRSYKKIHSAYSAKYEEYKNNKEMTKDEKDIGIKELVEAENKLLETWRKSMEKKSLLKKQKAKETQGLSAAKTEEKTAESVDVKEEKILQEEPEPQEEEQKSYYDVLKVPQSANDDRVEKAYGRIMDQYFNENAKEIMGQDEFMLVQKAAKTLLDPQKRKEYDAFIKAAKPSKRPGSWQKTKSREELKKEKAEDLTEQKEEKKLPVGRKKERPKFSPVEPEEKPEQVAAKPKASVESRPAAKRPEKPGTVPAEKVEAKRKQAEAAKEKQQERLEMKPESVARPEKPGTVPAEKVEAKRKQAEAAKEKVKQVEKSEEKVSLKSANNIKFHNSMSAEKEPNINPEEKLKIIIPEQIGEKRTPEKVEAMKNIREEVETQVKEAKKREKAEKTKEEKILMKMKSKKRLTQEEEKFMDELSTSRNEAAERRAKLKMEEKAELKKEKELKAPEMRNLWEVLGSIENEQDRQKEFNRICSSFKKGERVHLSVKGEMKYYLKLENITENEQGKIDKNSEFKFKVYDQNGRELTDRFFTKKISEIKYQDWKKADKLPEKDSAFMDEKGSVKRWNEKPADFNPPIEDLRVCDEVYRLKGETRSEAAENFNPDNKGKDGADNKAKPESYATDKDKADAEAWLKSQSERLEQAKEDLKKAQKNLENFIESVNINNFDKTISIVGGAILKAVSLGFARHKLFSNVWNEEKITAKKEKEIKEFQNKIKHIEEEIEKFKRGTVISKEPEVDKKPDETLKPDSSINETLKGGSDQSATFGF